MGQVHRPGGGDTGRGRSSGAGYHRPGIPGDAGEAVQEELDGMVEPDVSRRRRETSTGAGTGSGPTSYTVDLSIGSRVAGSA